MRDRLVVVLLCAALCVVVGTPSLADGTSLSDANDAYGPLDIKRIWHAHGRGGDLEHRLVTYGRWTTRALESDVADIRILFTVDRDNAPERVLVVDVQGDGDGLQAIMHRWNNGVGNKVYGRAAVQKTGPRGLRLVFERSLLRRNLREYGWHVDTRFHDPNHSRCKVTDGTLVVCPDSAPNANDPVSYLRHDV